MTSRGPNILFEEVGLKLGGNQILENLSFSVSSGSIHCLIGPNGGGKTSLIRSLLGQMPHSGTISLGWNGGKITGYVPQALDFDRTLPITVEDFMTIISQRMPVFCGTGQTTKPKIHTALERVGMAGKQKKPFGGLSGGERQRVLLAQALMPRPHLLILDEPATGLDKTGAAVMHGLLKELKDEGTTIVMIHHDLAEVKQIGDAVTCINRQLLFSGDPETLLTPERILSIFSSAQAA